MTATRTGPRSSSAPTQVELIWPDELILPDRPPLLLYLDLNHWINLSKARLGLASGAAYQHLLNACREAVQAGRIRIVLSGLIAEEILKISDPRQRHDLVDTIDELTDFKYLPGLPVIMRLELQSTLNTMTGTTGLGWMPVPLLGRGLLSAFGMVGGLRLTDAEGNDITDQELARPETQMTSAYLSQLEHDGERLLLAGPSDAEVPSLREAGYASEVPQRTRIGNAEFE